MFKISYFVVAMMITVTSSASSFLRALDENINKVPTINQMVSQEWRIHMNHISPYHMVLMIWSIWDGPYDMVHTIWSIWYGPCTICINDSIFISGFRQLCIARNDSILRTIFLIKIRKWLFQIVLATQLYLSQWWIQV